MAKAKKKQYKILLMEDEEIIGSIYRKSLEEAGFEVEWYKTTDETELAAIRMEPDVIFLDHGITGETRSGLDLLIDIKKVLPKAKIIMFSNYNESQIEKDAKKAGATGYLIKLDTPPDILIEYVKKLLS